MYIYLKYIKKRDFYFLDTFSMKVDSSGCECVKYNCGCCQHLVWNAVSLDGNCEYIIICNLYYDNYSMYSIVNPTFMYSVLQYKLFRERLWVFNHSDI